MVADFLEVATTLPPFRGHWSKVMAVVTALRREWSRVWRRAGPWRRPSLWVPSVVPLVRPVLDPMARGVWVVRAVLGSFLRCQLDGF